MFFQKRNTFFMRTQAPKTRARSPRDPRIGFFNALAARWEREKPSAASQAARLRRHAARLALRPGQAVLEVGCGTGKATAWLAKQVAPARITAVDFAGEMLARARAKGIPADFLRRDVCRDDLGVRRYDLILCLHSFPHFRDPAAALRRFARALKTEGRLVIMHFCGSAHLNEFHARVKGPVHADRLPVGAEWPPLLKRAGLALTQSTDRADLFFLEAVRAPRRA